MSRPLLSRRSSDNLLDYRADAIYPAFAPPESVDLSGRFLPVLDQQTVGVAHVAAALAECRQSALRVYCSPTYIADRVATDNSLQDRFEEKRERRIAGFLSHPNLSSTEPQVHLQDGLTTFPNTNNPITLSQLAANVGDLYVVPEMLKRSSRFELECIGLSDIIDPNNIPDHDLRRISQDSNQYIALDMHGYVSVSPRVLGANPDDLLSRDKTSLSSYDASYERQARVRDITMLESLATLQYRGCPHIDTYTGPSDMETITVMGDALEFRISGYASVSTVLCAKRALYRDGPLAIIFPCYNYGTAPWQPSRPGQSPTDMRSVGAKLTGTDMLGYHAMTIVGYDKHGFLLRNSWGRNWGNDGHTIFSYDDWGMHTECWTKIGEHSNREEPVKNSGMMKTLVRAISRKSSTDSSPRTANSSPRSAATSPRGAN